MAKYIDEMDAAMKDYENVVIAAHCPPMGILDKARGGVSYGNSLMANYLSYKALNVRAFLCGHIHEDHGITMFSNILISNAACVVHNLQLEFWRSKFED
jgi:Icc-related predicted phosphoesterase